MMMIRPTRKFVPPTDVIELEDRLLVQVEVAGMRHSDFEIELQNHHLIISGTRSQPARTPLAYYQVEIGYGRFRVEITLPWPVESEHVSASYEAGFLQIELPRKAPTQVRIVNTEAQQQ